ncbi:MAG: hypothetical protein A2W90_08470 [Bacteroidetes bacterium GWF2_42_66]|nr:MAG: hypothetical protein A2W89_06130 [Bacteroidetes bacterium GWE2_42_39]OFY40924.1 MAG: hypothetical protein A2W90_08470 [Bacteroidetes bacterium GWF2_42_66]HBL76359.1 hypothetical protein [Prolixibacteraceae bacterium]
MFCIITSCGDRPSRKPESPINLQMTDSTSEDEAPDDYPSVNALLVSPGNPHPGEAFRILATGGKNIRKAKIIVSGPSGNPESLKSKNGEGLPFWRIDDFAGSSAGKYTVTLIAGKKEVCNTEFIIPSEEAASQKTNGVWKTIRGWDSRMEALYSAWINALFQDCDEQASWSALHEVTQNQDKNFLYNHFSLGEDDPNGKNKVIMQPDCADNPFFLRAYFAWKLGLPFGYHVCDRGYLGRNPNTGQWITNETSGSKTHPILAFNSFLRRVMDGVHSGTARTSLDNENSDYYPVSLHHGALRPGTVYADPYGHTLILISWMPQTSDHPGMLLSVDAQPDGTVGIKRFWKGNFLFNTSEVVGEPGFKTFRPISLNDGTPLLMQNKALTNSAGFIPFSLQQRKMEADVFYHTMERLINPKPLDPEDALLDLIRALHEQLMVRITSVANGEAYFKSHPGTVIPMPSNAAGVFQTGGQWENFSTPNRDLRLLIAMDAVLDFPDRIVRTPEDFDISSFTSPEQVKKKLQTILDEKVSELSISYTRTDGSLQKLTIKEILARRDAFEMAYNPNDGVEIRWGAPENSDERSTCRRHTPSYQLERMRSVRKWFTNRLHPPT